MNTTNSQTASNLEPTAEVVIPGTSMPESQNKGPKQDRLLSITDANELESLLLDSIKNGIFLETCYQHYLYSDMSSEKSGPFENALIKIHNEKQANIIQEFSKIKNPKTEQTKYDFWILADGFSKLVPLLDADIHEIVNLLARFDEIGKGDLAAGIWWNELAPLFEEMPQSRDEVIALGLKEETIGGGLCTALRSAFSANLFFYFPYAISLLNQTDGLPPHAHDRILSACRDLQVVSMPEELRKIYYETLLALVHRNQPTCSFSVLYDCIHSITIQKDNWTEASKQLLEELFQINDQPMLWNVALRLSLDINKTPNEEIGMSLKALLKTDVENKGILARIDYLLHRMIDSGMETAAIDFIADFLCKNNGNADMFPRAIHALRETQGALLSERATQWLLSKNLQREHIAARMFSDDPFGKSQIEYFVDTTQLQDIGPNEALTFCAKAVGLLFDNPRALFGFVFPTLDYLDDHFKEKMLKIIYDLIVLIYLDNARNWLSNHRNKVSKLTSEQLERLFSEADNYYNHFQRFSKIPELNPTADQLKTAEKDAQKAFKESFDKAMENSILAKIATQVVLLHGKKSAYADYLPGNDDIKTADLQTHSLTMTVPRLPAAIGLEFRWKRFALTMGDINIDNTEELS